MWNLQSREAYTVFSLKRDSESGLLLGKAGGDVGSRTSQAARNPRQNENRMRGHGKREGSRSHKQRTETNFACHTWRQASHHCGEISLFPLLTV